MTLYILHVAAAIIVFFSGVFIYSRNFFKKANLAFFLFSLAISCWLFFSFVSYASLDVSEKLFWFKVSYFGIIFIPITFFHFISNFTRGKYDSALLLMSYVIGFIVFFILLFDRLIIGLHQYHWGFYPKVDPVFHVPFLIFFSSLFMVSLSRLVLKLFKKGAEISFLERARLKYLCIGGFLGIFGSIDFFPNYGISIYPMGFIFMVVLYCIFGYAFYKFYLLDIRVAVARAGIFGCVYALVLGAPFILGYKYDLWIQSIWMMLILATSGPFIFLFFQKRVEEELLKEDFRVQEFLVQASQGATTIHKISELNIFVKDTLGKMLQLNKIELYFLDRLGQYYEIFEEAEDHADDRRLFVDDAGVEYLKIQNAPIVYEEIRVRAADGRTSDKGLRVLCSIMGREGFQIIVPIHMSNIMTGFICLGDRRNNESYSNGLLNALLVLGNQIALAIENCRYIEAESLRMEEQGFQERVASLDMMAASFAHEIDNPMTVISGQIDFLQEILQDEAIVLAIPDQMRAAVLESLDYIMDASRRVSGMIEAILEYSRMGTGELKPVRINEVAEGFFKDYYSSGKDVKNRF